MQLLRLCGLLALVAVGIQEVAPQKQVLITFPKDTPQSTLDTYRTAITSAEGSILHEYKLIKGFVVKASVEAIEGFHALSADHPATIEEDTTVTIQ